MTRIDVVAFKPIIYKLFQLQPQKIISSSLRQYGTLWYNFIMTHSFIVKLLSGYHKNTFFFRPLISKRFKWQPPKFILDLLLWFNFIKILSIIIQLLSRYHLKCLFPFWPVIPQWFKCQAPKLPYMVWHIVVLFHNDPNTCTQVLVWKRNCLQMAITTAWYQILLVVN